MSKKQVKQFVFIVLGLIICVIGYLVLGNYSQKQKEIEEKESKKVAEENMTVVFEMDSVEDVTGLAYVAGEETIMLLKDSDGKWLNSADETANIDESIVESTMLTNFIHVESSEVIESPDDLSVYGFDKPTNQIVISMADGSSHTFIIGAQNAFDTSLYYMMLEGDSKVYVIDSVIPNAFSSTVEELIVEETTMAEETN